jgi:streptogramin lyase
MTSLAISQIAPPIDPDSTNRKAFAPMAHLTPRASKQRRPWAQVDTLEGRRLLALDVVTLPLPQAGQLQKIVNGPDNNIWFTEAVNGSNELVRMGSITGAILNTYTIAPNATVSGLAVGPDGNFWFGEGSAIGRFNFLTGQERDFAIDSNLTVTDITAGPDGNLWFTDSGLGIGNIGRITTSGMTQQFLLPTSAEPNTITVGPDGNLWFGVGMVDFQQHVVFGRIGQITPAGVLTVFAGSVGSAAPSGITSGPDGNLWITDGADNRIERISPATGQVTGTFSVPTAASLPFGITVGPDLNIWFTESNANQLGQLNVTTGVITESQVPGFDPTPGSIVTSVDGNLWFLENAHTPGQSATVPDIGVAELSGHGPAPVGGQTAPVVTSVQVLRQTVVIGHTRRGKPITRREFAGFQLTFSEPLDPVRAQSIANYSVATAFPSDGRVFTTAVPILQVLYTPSTATVSILVARTQRFPTGGLIVVNAAAPGGITDIFGDFLRGRTQFAIARGAR